MKGKDSKTTKVTEDTNNKTKKIIIGIILMIITIIILLLLLNKTEYTISFNSNGGSLVEKVSVNKNSTILEPEAPTRENYVFAGWYYNDELYDFNTPVTSDIELEAKWENVEKVSGIKLDKQEISLSVGDTSKLIVTIEPENAENKTLIWESSNPNIVSVDSNGNIKALKEGTATITVTTQDGDYTAKTEVIVKKLDITEKEKQSETTNTYSITFVNYDGTVLETKKVELGTIPTYTKNTPTKTSDEKYTYIFAGWSPSVTEVDADATYVATFTEKINVYKVTFIDEDGRTLSDTQTVEYGDKAQKPEKPTKEGHTFEGWYNGKTEYTFTEEVKEDIALVAKWTKNKYTITFVNYDGTVLETKTVEYGTTPTYTKEIPTRVQDNTYTYSFNGWDKEFAEVKENVTYTATFTSTYIEYVIRFVDEDGTELSKRTYHYGDIVEQPAIPTKPADEQYTYTFAGWSSNITPVEKDITYAATYTKTLNIYEVTFRDEDGTELSSTQTVKHGSKATEPKDPTKQGNVFEGWYNGDTKYTFTEEVKENVNLIARWTKIKYTITFVNYDDTVLGTKTVEYGTIPTYTGETPTKPADEQYTYTFKEWSPSIVAVETDTIYTATYKETLNKYEVTFTDEDGTTLADTQTVEYGSRAREPKTPSKRGYEFQGWYNGQIRYTFTEEVKCNIELTAKWGKNKYTITFVNEDGTVLETKTVEHGEIPTYTESTPTKSADNIFKYSFKGWDKEIEEATRNTTYTATYTATYIDYVIRFVDEDGTELSKQTYHYGDTVEQPTNPIKPSTTQYTYTFAGWNPNVTTVKGNTTYTATYTEVLKSYEVTFTDEDGTTLADTQTVEYGSKAVEPTEPIKQGYTFQGWYNGDTKYTFTEEVKENVNLIARWTKIRYTITFVNYDGTVLETKTVEQGETPTYTKGTPTRNADNTYSYTFTGWSPSIIAAEEDTTYTAVFKSYVDVDKRIDDAISGVNAKEFKVTKTGKTIDVKFISYTENGVTVNPPYELIDLASGVVNLLQSLSSDPTYKSVVVNYKGETLDAKNYDMTDAANWLAYLCGKSGMFGLLSATTDDLVGKTVKVTITLKDEYRLEDGKQSIDYNLTFSE